MRRCEAAAFREAYCTVWALALERSDSGQPAIRAMAACCTIQSTLSRIMSFGRNAWGSPLSAGLLRTLVEVPIKIATRAGSTLSCAVHRQFTLFSEQ